MQPLSRGWSPKHLVLLATIALSLIVSLALGVEASPTVLPKDESGSLKVVLSVSPNVSRRGGTITIAVKIGNVEGAVAGAVVKILLTFSDGRQISASGMSDVNGTLSYTARIPSGVSPGSGKVDVIVRTAGTVAIESSSFTVK